MKIRYTCSNCGQKFQSSAMVGVPDGMFLSGCRAVGDAFYCEECVKTWADTNRRVQRQEERASNFEGGRR